MKTLTKLLGVLLLSLAFAVQAFAGEMPCPTAHPSSVISEMPISNTPVAPGTATDIEILSLGEIALNVLGSLGLLI